MLAAASLHLLSHGVGPQIDPRQALPLSGLILLNEVLAQVSK
ncbi:hypothetical protein EV13_3056 [Prochlorococcus sp. MIT 0702]|nr:hypothetical protein EV12_3017 [Prochlorococcus sp. MIT 0701]KGG25723.1 hypothetical protein EV13_3056 [Prochlorococcus sp. MIT 0702]KGG31980.1 hypothetical protein EV14_2105 [Prochlorococcus sp. MIT 0703]